MTLGTFSGVLRRQWLPFIAVLLAGVAAFLVLMPVLRSYSATSTVLVSTSSTQNTATLDPNKDPTSSGLETVDLETLLTGSVVMNRVAADLHLSDADAEKLPSAIKTKITVGSGIMPITYTNKNAELAMQGANAAARELARYDGEIKTSRYDRLLADMDRQIATQEGKLAGIDSQISGLTSNDAFLTDDQGRTGLNTRIIALEQQRDQLAASLRGDAASLAVANQRPAISHDLAKSEIMNADPAIAQIKTQYGKDLAQANVMKAGYSSAFEGLAAESALIVREGRSMRSEIADATANPKMSATYVTSLLDANRAQGTVAQDRAQLATVQGELSTLTEHLNGSNTATTQLASLRRQRSAIEDAYHVLVQNEAKTQTDRAQAASIDSVVVVDLADHAPQSVFSRPPILGAAIALAALWLAIALSFVLDGNDRRLHTPESIEALYGKPVYTPVG